MTYTDARYVTWKAFQCKKLGSDYYDSGFNMIVMLQLGHVVCAKQFDVSQAHDYVRYRSQDMQKDHMKI